MLRKKLKNKYSEGYEERCGIISEKKLRKIGKEKPLWIHCVSVGEVQAAVPLIKAARDNSYTGPIIISTTTITGKLMAYNLAENLFDLHIYYPWDKKDFVSKALETIKPWGFVAMETELWPNMLWELKKKNIPAFASNCRISDRTWKRLSSNIIKVSGKELYESFTQICLREKRDEKRLIKLGIKKEKLHYVGDTKIDALRARRDETKTKELKKELGLTTETVFTAGSLHIGEDEEILKAYEHLPKSKQIKLIVVPRHPERAEKVKELFTQNYNAKLMSENDKNWDVLIVDKIGILFDIYGISTTAFVGGSMVDKGGQNILEPITWGIPIQFGIYMQDFAEASKELLSIGIAKQVHSSKELGEEWEKLLTKETQKKYLTATKQYIDEQAGAGEKTWKIISKYTN
ncbi:MAG: glycosyltransferase N-terminal domain-containing protein [Synergistaceae bacterium]